MRMRDTNLHIVSDGIDLLVKLLRMHEAEKGSCVCKVCCDLRILLRDVDPILEKYKSREDLYRANLTPDQIINYVKYLKNYLNIGKIKPNGVNTNTFWYRGSQL